MIPLIVGASYITRDGSKVKLVGTGLDRINNDNRMVAAVRFGDKQYTVDRNGQHRFGGEPHDLDLLYLVDSAVQYSTFFPEAAS